MAMSLGISNRLESFLKELKNCSQTKEKNYGNGMEKVKLGPDDLAPFIHFRDDMYTRNLIYTDEHFELMALCWSKGHVTPIHDHAGSHGWMVVVQGLIEEEQFDLKPFEGDTFKLTSQHKLIYHPGDVSHISDEIGVHIIRNLHVGPSVTLHVYAPPIKNCQYYESTLSPAKHRELRFYSVFGKLI